MSPKIDYGAPVTAHTHKRTHTPKWRTDGHHIITVGVARSMVNANIDSNGECVRPANDKRTNTNKKLNKENKMKIK